MNTFLEQCGILQTARWEFYTKRLSTMFGSPFRGCVALAVPIIFFVCLRDIQYETTLKSQPKWELLQTMPVSKTAASGLLAVGMTLVIWSFWTLGFTGTFFGDYFGILLDQKVTKFPYNIPYDPMYLGSTLNFLGLAIWHASPVGFILTGLVGTSYHVALKYERPFTDAIYRQKELRIASQKRELNKKES
ncbi:phosphatidylethanolamine N-methyltransferase-like isoform X2 [Anneissia japonica]|uniref:phosphatidylethanolamine N-methyltransferase-like isoform X2 n=1 Tax=Anneissia japonica TaxID=1529436 RepID=UPI0014255865|nr:phosphatidylethanolamine N-methyltransferase-like isoform X2 [Anneissia japonica]